MKKAILLLSTCLVALPVVAQLTGDQSDYEPFSDATAGGGTSYPVGQSLAGNSPTLAAGFDSVATADVGTPSWWGYTNTTTLSSSPSPTIVSGDLSYPGLASTGGGQSAQFYGQGASALMNLTTDTGGTGYTAGGGYTTVYYSFALSLSDVSSLPTDQSGADLIAGFTKVESHKANTSTPTSIGAQLWIRSDGGTGYQLGLEGGSGANNVAATPTYGSTSYHAGDTLFIVGAYDLGTGQGSLWLNPTPGGAQPAADVTDTASSLLQRVASFTLFGDDPTVGSSDTAIVGQIDDLRDGLTWASVTPVPEPSAWVFGGMGLVCLWALRFRRKSV